MEPLFSIGLVADIQYANQDTNYTKNRTRYYRESLVYLREAFDFWNNADFNIIAILQLGDIIDGINKSKLNESDIALDLIRNECLKSLQPIHHTWGNHELYNFSFDELKNSWLNSSKDKNPYYFFEPHEHFVLVMLQGYELSTLGHEENSEEYQRANELILAHNKNDNLNSDDGLEGPNRRYVEYNGGTSEAQIKWLDDLLHDCDTKNKRVIICSHNPVHPKSCFAGDTKIMWNYDVLLDTLHKHHSVVAFFAGHDHDGGYANDEHGIHHITFKALVESDPGCLHYYSIVFFTDRMEVYESHDDTNPQIYNFGRKPLIAAS